MAFIYCTNCHHIEQAYSHTSCPLCGNTYLRTPTYLDSARHIAMSPQSGASKESINRDGSALTLICTNVILAIAAVFFNWSLIELIVVYFAQSLFIGLCFFFRMRALENYTSDNCSNRYGKILAAVKSKNEIATVYLLYYMACHLAYLAIIQSGLLGYPERHYWQYSICLSALALHQLYSFHYHRRKDKVLIPDICSMRDSSYYQMLPIHGLLFIGVFLSKAYDMTEYPWLDNNMGILVFTALKTFAELLMHQHEYTDLVEQDA